MPTKDAAATVAAFRLPSEEDEVIYYTDIMKMSIVAVSQKMCMSPETVKRRRAAAYERIAAELTKQPLE